jgi:hypothetical protein
MRLTDRHKRWVYWSSGLLFISGLFWLAFHYFVRVRGQFGETPHPLEPWWLRVHGGAAMLFLVVVGSLLPIHVRRGWHQRKNLRLGIVILSTALLLTCSGYALYYFGGEETRPFISAFHWIIGLAAPVLLTWHIVAGRALYAPASHGPSASAQRSGPPAPTRHGRDNEAAPARITSQP